MTSKPLIFMRPLVALALAATAAFAIPIAQAADPPTAQTSAQPTIAAAQPATAEKSDTVLVGTLIFIAAVAAGVLWVSRGRASGSSSGAGGGGGGKIPNRPEQNDIASAGYDERL